MYGPNSGYGNNNQGGQQRGRDNSGVIKANARKTQDKHPDMKGAATIDGVEYWISAWRRVDDATGEEKYSLAFEKKQQR